MKFKIGDVVYTSYYSAEQDAVHVGAEKIRACKVLADDEDRVYFKEGTSIGDSGYKEKELFKTQEEALEYGKKKREAYLNYRNM
jgi:hypothetical protein